MQAGSKRRRTKRQIEDDKAEELLKKQKLAADEQELQDLRVRMTHLEQEAATGKAAAQFLSQMINDGHI